MAIGSVIATSFLAWLTSFFTNQVWNSFSIFLKNNNIDMWKKAVCLTTSGAAQFSRESDCSNKLLNQIMPPRYVSWKWFEKEKGFTFQYFTGKIVEKWKITIANRKASKRYFIVYWCQRFHNHWLTTHHRRIGVVFKRNVYVKQQQRWTCIFNIISVHQRRY